MTYGFQASKARAGLPPLAFDTGYVDLFAARLASIRPGITTVNYGCPGESTGSFLAGPCVWRASGHALHDDYPGAQVEAAVAFLRAHPGQVSPVTVTLWGNDMRLFIESCGGDVACVRARAPAAIAGLTANLAEGLRRLRSAAPNTEIIVMGAFHTYLGFEEVATPLIVALNNAMQRAAASVQAEHRSRVAHDRCPSRVLVLN